MNHNNEHFQIIGHVGVYKQTKLVRLTTRPCHYRRIYLDTHFNPICFVTHRFGKAESCKHF